MVGDLLIGNKIKTAMIEKQVVVIGGGQARLSVGYFLKRVNLDFVILDDQEDSGGAWRKTWLSLKPFSPGEYSSLGKTEAKLPAELQMS